MRAVPTIRKKPATLEQRVLRRIERDQDGVFLTSEFKGLGNADSVLRTLRGLVGKGKLLKLGTGVYTTARPSRIDGSPVSVIGEEIAVRRALTKLGVDWMESRAVVDYNAGRSTQIPVNPVFRVRGRRMPRRLTEYGREVKYELVP